MDIRMASLPGCGLGGGGGGGGGSSSNSHGNTMVKGYQVTKDNHHTISPQVTFICGQPPMLDTTGCKPSTSRTTSGFCRSTRRVGGNIFTSLRNMYNSICSSPPSLTWVNPEIIPEFHPAVAPSLSLETPYSMADAFYIGQNEPLWYQATPGSQFEYEDPLQVLYPFSDTLPPFSSNFPPGSTCSFSKSSQPLNPEAKEWVPSGYKDNNVIKSSLSDCSEIPFDKNILPTQATGDFIEITESEIDAVRKSSNGELPQKTWDCLVVESSNKKLHPTEGEVTGFCIIPQKYSLESEMKTNKNVCCDVLKDEVLEQLEICKVPAEAGCFKQEDHLSPSYASITQKSPEPPIKHNTKIAFEEKNIAPPECVKQPLPKIFTKDKIYPKEKAPLVMENQKREVLPFKTASKLQKKSSKKFLRDLKESSPVKADTSFSGSEGSWESATDIISGFCVSSSPVILGLHGNEFFREKTESIKSHRSSSESSASSHVRTVSESTVGSVESIDIEFGEDFDIHENKHDDNRVLADHCKSKSSVEGKYVNSIVAHILCFDESDSEDSDGDSDDSDWDTVQECIINDVDESWETFGLSIPLLTKSLPCSESGNNKLKISEDVCDNVGSSSLTEINKKWNKEVCKDVVDATPCKVNFGEVKVYPMISWSFAYRNARRGPWEQYARDRSRFNNRVLSLEPIISPILSDNHRKAMYFKLYGL